MGRSLKSRTALHGTRNTRWVRASRIGGCSSCAGAFSQSRMDSKKPPSSTLRDLLPGKRGEYRPPLRGAAIVGAVVLAAIGVFRHLRSDFPNSSPSFMIGMGVAMLIAYAIGGHFTRGGEGYGEYRNDDSEEKNSTDPNGVEPNRGEDENTRR